MDGKTENQQDEAIVRVKDVSYDYYEYPEEGKEPTAIRAVDDISLEIRQGEFVAVLGHNGSGKSTLAKHLNALLLPTEGSVTAPVPP